MDALPTDVEQALQHAIGHANSALVPYTDIGQQGAQRKKGNKRARIDAAREGDQPKKKRKNKKHAHPEDHIPDPAPPESNIDPALLAPAAVETNRNKPKNRKHSSHPPASNDPGPTIALPDLPPAPAPPNHPESTPSLAPDPPAQLNTNDDILRAFQDLDLARLAGVFRSLDLPPNADLHAADTLLASLLRQSPAPPADAPPTPPADPPSPPRRASRPAKPPPPAPAPNPNLPAIGPSIANPAHTQLLATKWLSAAKLKALEESEGLAYKKGKFSAIEDQALKASLEDYRVTRGLSLDEITEIVFSKTKEDHKSFWSDITASVPARPIIAVYHHVRRIYHPLKFQGKWSAAEDVALTQGVSDLGHAWEKVSLRVGRAAQDCRDRWRNHIAHRAEKHKGPWTKQEEAELTRIVQELQQGRAADTDIFWGVVSQRMGNRRGMQQCRIKWTDALSRAVKSGGQSPRWGKHDAAVLVHRVAALGVRDDSEIDWKRLPDARWSLWSAHNLQRRWRALRRAVAGHEAMAFREIVDVLVERHAGDGDGDGDGAAKAKAKTPRREPKSAVVIEDEEAGQALGDAGE